MNGKRIVGMVLSVMMLLSMIPAGVLGTHTPNDPYWDGFDGRNEQYGPQRTFNDEAWDLTDNTNLTNPGSRTIIVADIDTGVNYNHEDLENMIYTFPNNTHGYDFYDGDTDPIDEGFNGIYHGTATAGVVAAQMDNELGIAGTAQVTILPIRLIGDAGIPPSAIFNSIIYAADNGADIISMSFDFDPGLWESYFDAAFEYAWNRGCLLVAAAGNGVNDPIDYPARNPLVIAVGATDEEGIQEMGRRVGEKLWYNSSYLRTNGGEVCCIAPGDNITTIYTDTSGNSLYENRSGTSYACPHVAGCLALLLSYRPSLTNEEAWRMLNATCMDLEDPNDDDSPTHDDDPGYDIYSGYGLIDIYMALSHGNLQRDQWSNHTLISNESVNFNFTTSTPGDRQAVAIDSQGFSHVVWIDKRNNTPEVFYSSVEPSGRVWTYDQSLETGHACQQTASSYADLFIDNLDNVHVCWLDENDIYYTRLDTQGSPNLPPGNPSIIQVTTSPNTPKEYLNIITDDTPTPSIYFYYGIQDSDWDIAWSKITVNGQGIYQVTFSDTKLINYVYDTRKVYADVGLMTFSMEQVFLVYQKDESNNWDVEWRQYDFNGVMNCNRTVGNTNDDEEDPYIDVAYEFGASAIVWRRLNGNDDEIYYRVIGPTSFDYTYGGEAYKIGYSFDGGMYGGKEYPKVAIAVTQNQIPNPYFFANHEIHVVWRQWNGDTGLYTIFQSRCNADGRPFQAPNETLLTDEGYGYPLVTSVDEGSTLYAHYIKDGHFRATWFQREDYDDSYMIAYRTTNALWKGIRNVTVTDDVEKESDLVIDANGNYHLAWTIENASGGREIRYANWIDTNPYGAPATEANITQNASDTDSYRPKIVTFEDAGIMKVVMIWVDEVINSNGDLWITCFEAEDPNQVDLAPTNISCSPADNNQEVDFRIANDDQNQWIVITWCENYQSNVALWLGVVGYDNSQIVQENIVTYSPVYNCSDPSICVEEQTSTANIAYVRDYNTYNLVFYSQIYVGMSYYSKNFDTNITDNGYYRYPEIVIDHETRRLEGNSFGIRSYANRDRYVHIVYSKIMYEGSPQRHALYYQKLFLNSTKVIDEKIILPDDYADVPAFKSYAHIRSVVRLDVDNRLEIISLAEDFRGNMWPIPSDKLSIYYSKLDNNGEILCAEMFINDNETYNCQDITTAIDEIGQVHVVWTENTNLRYCSNGISTLY